ncbi:MAG: DUF2085 domain-containing protein [Anaerolineae bacterium]
MNLIGYGICHQEAARSFSLGGQQLPLCARCTGTYLGAIVSMAVILASRRRRASGLPTPVPLAVFMAGFAFFAVDGANSYAHITSRLPHLYTPDNRLRLLSGLSCGAGLAAILIPLFNYSVWHNPTEGPILDWRGLPFIVGGLAIMFLAVVWGPEWFYYPLALMEAVGVVLVLSTVNGLLAWLLGRREQQAYRWRDTLPLFSIGFLMMAVEIGGMGYLRYVLETATPLVG